MFSHNQKKMRKNAFSCCKYPSVGFTVSPSTAIKPKKNGTNKIMEFKDAESFSDIEIGDLVRVQRGPLESSTQIVSGITRTINTFCPIMGWYGGPSLKFSFIDGGSAHHFQLDQQQPIQEKNWLP